MLKRIGNFVMKHRWFVIVFWILLTGVVLLKAPVLSEVAKGDQASFLPSNAETAEAAKLIKKLYPNQGSGSSLILTFYRKNGINNSDIEYGKRLEKYLLNNKSVYKIKEVVSPFTNTKLKGSMLSNDKEAALIMVNLTVPGYKDLANEAVRSIRSKVQESSFKGQNSLNVPKGLVINVTGEAPIGEEQMTDVKKSMDLITKITVVLVVLILIIIYRSPVAFWVPLTTIGISFLVSRGIVALLTYFGLKVSSFTETFLIAVLFGAGTDYCLLMISRFKEELILGKSEKEALGITIPNTGIAILSSGGTVIVGFLGMVFAKFGLFNTTGPSIAIGVAITLLAVMTLTPAIISLLGERIFWPAHPSKLIAERRVENRFWTNLSKTVTSKPGTFIIICLIISLPFLISVRGVSRSFDQLAELPKGSDAVKGFNVIKAHYNQGEMLPIKVVLESDKELWVNDSLRTIDDIAKNMIKVDGVVKVRTATRPLGEQINETTLPSQIEKLSGGLGQVQGGFEPIIGSLDKMESGIKKISGGVSEGSSQLGKLVDATKQASDGIGKVSDGLNKLYMGTVSSGDGLIKINTGIKKLSIGLSGARDGVSKIHQAMESSQKSMENVLVTDPALTKDADFLKAYGTIKAVMGNIGELEAGLEQIDGGLISVQSNINDVNKGLSNISGGINTSNKYMKTLETGLVKMRDGQKKAISGFDLAAQNLMSITSGLEASKGGLVKIKNGLSKVQDVSQDYSAGNGLRDIFYLPAGALEKYPKLKEAMDFYISPNGKGVTLEVILSVEPYSREALDSVSKIKEAVAFTLKGTSLKKAEFHIGGSISAVSEMRDITAGDFSKVMFFVLLGIFIVLMIMLRSVVAPVYLILTIILSFASTMGLSYIVFQVLLGHEGLTWSVPFFSFCLLVALGVDYNIFLMSRVKEEYTPGNVKGGVARALATTGGIITSCGIIMAGTFGAFMASPVTQLVEIGFATVVGLLLDTFIIRCLLVPAVAVKVGELNWWPGKKVRIVSSETKNSISTQEGIIETSH